MRINLSQMIVSRMKKNFKCSSSVPHLLQRKAMKEKTVAIVALNNKNMHQSQTLMKVTVSSLIPILRLSKRPVLRASTINLKGHFTEMRSFSLKKFIQF